MTSEIGTAEVGTAEVGTAEVGPAEVGPVVGGTPGVAAGSRDVRVGGRRLEVDPHSCFACGELNEHGLHLILHAQDHRCWTDAVLDRRFEGWEGVTHGGILCAILDEVMAWSLVEHDAWGLTARLNVEFRRPVTVGTAVHAEGWLVEARRRILKTAGQIVDATSGQVLATAEATYLAASEARKAELKARYRFRLVPENASGGDAGGSASDRAGEPAGHGAAGEPGGHGAAGEPGGHGAAGATDAAERVDARRNGSQ